MDASKKWMDEHGGERISFKDGKAHTVKLLKDKEDTITDGRGGIVKGIKFLVEENGRQTTFFTGSIGLISKLTSCQPGDVVTIKMGVANNKSFFTVTKADGSEVGAAAPVDEVDVDDVPPGPEW